MGLDDRRPTRGIIDSDQPLVSAGPRVTNELRTIDYPAAEFPYGVVLVGKISNQVRAGQVAFGPRLNAQVDQFRTVESQQ